MIMQRPTSGPVPVSKLQPVEPLDRGFNVAVHTIANHLNPRGWHISEVWSPDSLTALNDVVQGYGRLVVSRDHSDHTIFADPETNYAFRAWHDWHHWRLQAPFNMEGEIAVANSQAGDLINLYGARKSKPWREILRAEVIGQAQYQEYHGAFPTDQMGFVKHYLSGHGSMLSRVFH